MKMLGKLGWWGFCSCCNTRRTKRQMRALEKRTWKEEIIWRPTYHLVDDSIPEVLVLTEEELKELPFLVP